VTEERIAKRIARSGRASRREAERLIHAGRVTLNGQVLTTPAVTVGEDDVISVDERPLAPAAAPKLVAYHKPGGRLTTRHDPDGRATIYDDLPADEQALMPVGRLDMTTEGLLLLTNDGALKRALELPATGLTRVYRVRVHGSLSAANIAKLGQGVTIDGVRYAPIELKFDEAAEGRNQWLSLTLVEGKNREVRRVVEWLGGQVSRLIRVRFGPFELGALPAGAVRPLTIPDAIVALRER